MNKFWIVTSHTFLSNLKTKSFLITTIITALLIMIVFSIPTIIELFDQEGEATSVGVVPSSSELFATLDSMMNYVYPNEYALQQFSDEASARNALDAGNIEAYLILSQNEEGIISGTYKALKINDSEMLNSFEQVLNQMQFTAVSGTIGLTEEQTTKLFQKVDLEAIALDENAKSAEEIVQSVVLVYILLFAIYMAVVMFGNMIAMEVAKEKSSRIMEILISSVPPITQLFGKILGTAFLGIFQIAVFVLAGFVAFQFGSKTVDLGGLVVDFSRIPIATIIYAVIFFILGYLLYATIAAMLGSIVSRIEELQQMLTPMTLLIVAGFMLAMFGLATPDAGYIKVTSFIPFFTPMIMFLRIGTSDPAVWEIFLSIGLLVATIIFFAILAAKVYRGGVLMYGKSASLKDLKKAMTLHKD